MTDRIKIKDKELICKGRILNGYKALLDIMAHNYSRALESFWKNAKLKHPEVEKGCWSYDAVNHELTKIPEGE